MFAGRYHEMLALEKALFQTKNGNPTHFLIDGERGIGKSSLLFNVEGVATGDFQPFEDPKTLNFVTVSICLDATHTYSDIVRCIGSELRRQIAAREHLKEFAKGAWEFLSKWEIGGIRFRDGERTETKETELAEELTFALASSVDRLKTEVDGVLILIDEADKPPASANLGSLIKLLTERLRLRRCDRVCIGLAGLTTLRDKLRDSHESSLRLFNIFALNPLSPEDCLTVLERGLVEAKEKNGVETRIEEPAARSLAFITEGYPHFVQQFAYCAFDADSDNNIDTDDLGKGAFAENGALKQLGLKYFERQYFDQIWSDEYRQVLQVMSQHFDGWVTKGAIRKEAPKLKASTLDNALSALKSRGIIAPKKGTKGTYKLPSRSFAVWIRAYTQTEELIASTPTAEVSLREMPKPSESPSH
ncbi:MAG: AAA family ATPase [Candidatus Sulfotelmatobacter sp.]